MKTKKATKRAPARKVNAVHREREGKQKKNKVPPHVECEGPIPPPDIVMEHDQQAGWGPACEQAKPEPPYMASMEKAIYGLQDELRQLRRECERDESDWVSIILKGRTLREILSYVYDRGGHAWPAISMDAQRVMALQVIRGLVRRHDVETMAFVLATGPY